MGASRDPTLHMADGWTAASEQAAKVLRQIGGKDARWAELSVDR
jgi:hypothetical protein